MPDTRRHRSAAPQDPALFAPARLPALVQAVEELSWLLTRGYAENAARKLVGDRYELRNRQRQAMLRCSCDQKRAAERWRRQLRDPTGPGLEVVIDGFNLLTNLESALGGGLILLARDRCARDLAGLGGTWRRVVETLPAAALAGEFLGARGIESVLWVLDQPVSNSGRLAALLRELAQQRGWPWQVEIRPRVDELLQAMDQRVVISADRCVLDGCGPWWNLGRELIEQDVPSAWRVDLSGSP